MDDSRDAALDLSPEEFRALGHRLIDQISEFYGSMRERRVTPKAPLEDILAQVQETPFPTEGTDLHEVLSQSIELLFDSSTLIPHPRFWGYINGAPSLGAVLADLLSSAINQNCSAWYVSPAASAIEWTTLRWLSQLIGYRRDGGGVFVSGGTMANALGLVCAREERLGADVGDERARKLRIYATREAHSWLEKSVPMLGFRRSAIHYVGTDGASRMHVESLVRAIEEDKRDGYEPWCVVATTGTTGIGAIDPIVEIEPIAREHGMWLHVDAAYGGLAAASSTAPRELRNLRVADSIALDPHKWLYVPFEAGCLLVKDQQLLFRAFTHDSSYYGSGSEPGLPPHFRECTLQTSRGFKALKVWTNLRNAGATGLAQMIDDDMRLAGLMHQRADEHPDLEAFSHNLSITTFRYVPSDLDPEANGALDYLNELNRQILDSIQAGGLAYPSSTRVGEKYLIRICIVNFRTNQADIELLCREVLQTGEQLDRDLRPSCLSSPTAPPE